jgi:WD repeat-containing protein 68
LQGPSTLSTASSILNSTPASNGIGKIGGDSGQTPKRREAYRWASNLPIFAMAWSYKRYPNQRLRLACSSIRDGHELLKNTVTLEFLTCVTCFQMSIVEFDEEHGELTERTQVFIGAPSCDLKFIPTTDASQPDLIASATRELRIYSYFAEQQEIVLEAKLCPNKSYAYAGPLTSVDWNEVDPRIVGGSSIDSTCTIWDIEVSRWTANFNTNFRPKNQLQLFRRRLSLSNNNVSSTKSRLS